MFASYMRRRQSENRALAVAIVNALGESLGGHGNGAGNAKHDRVPAKELLADMGVMIGGADGHQTG